MLVKLSRLLSRGSPDELLPELADAAVEHVGADAAVIIEMQRTGRAKLVPSRNLEGAWAGWDGDVEAIDEELGERLLRECEGCRGRFTKAHTLPLMSGHDLFGALVLFYADPARVQKTELDLAGGLAAFAGVALGNAFQYEQLRQSYAEVRATRETLERTEKLRALGEMAAGVSHDLKNILNPLSLHLQLLKRSLKRGGEGADEAIAEMEQIVRRGVETLERLREFSRQAPEAKLEPVDPDRVAAEAIAIARPRISAKVRKRGVKLSAELGGAPLVIARPAELVAAVVNLVVNAIDALEDGGTVVVATGESDGKGWITVADDGPGIPEEVQHRIFEPFFTTKGREGTGLGLAMVYAFTQRHGGTLTLDTKPGQGTKFTIALPVAPR